MNQETLTLVLVILAAGCLLAMVVQLVFLMRTGRTVSVLTKRIEKRSKQMEGEVTDLADRLRSVTDNLKPLGEMTLNVKNSFEDIAGLAKQRAEDIDSLTQDVMRIGREQSAKIEYVVTDTVQKFEQTTGVIKKDVLRPTMEITAFVKGVRTALDYLFKGSRNDQSPDPEQEELFV